MMEDEENDKWLELNAATDDMAQSPQADRKTPGKQVSQESCASVVIRSHTRGDDVVTDKILVPHDDGTVAPSEAVPDTMAASQTPDQKVACNDIPADANSPVRQSE